MKLHTKLATSACLCLFGTAALADDTVRASNLEVKERLIAIEQINVSAEKEQAKPQVESERVAKLLEEAARIEETEVEVKER